MADLPELTEADIRSWTDPGSFSRGLRYHQDGHIINPRRQGNTLKARCIGSRPQPYRVEITLASEGIAYGHCSCPVGLGGYCKHTVALLLTWLHEPHIFTTVEDIETALERRSKAELIVLIRRMLDRHPDLETLLRLPVVGEAREVAPVDHELIRRQARGAFAGIGYDDWHAAYDVAQRLLELVQIGDDYAAIERWRDASTIYRIVMEEALDNYSAVHDESGYLHDVVDQCVDGLEACLIAAQDPSRRRQLLDALFAVYRWDLDVEGIDMGHRAPSVILEQATPEEKREVADWVRDALSGVHLWTRQAYGRFLLRLEEAWLDDEAFLRICRETGRQQDLVERLLAMDRVDESLAAARKTGDYDLLQLADVFVAQGYDELAEALIRERRTTSPDTRLTVWLKDRALQRGDPKEALALAEELFWQRPTLPGYQELRALALPLDRWDERRRAILARLNEEEKLTLLIEIHLDEGAVDRALEALERVSSPTRWYPGIERLTIQVAQAAEDERPREAIRLYVEAAEQLIAQRGRGNYAIAGTYLSRVRDLYRRLDDDATWRRTIAELRDSNRRLRALKDELNKAGL